ncbi:MAG: hypothetical protein Kow0065_04730 [Methylomicrobium sp.]
MQRCPCCHARLSAEPACKRCGADLRRALQSERLASQWLAAALQLCSANRPSLAARAVRRSLSFKQTSEARCFQAFLIEHQYRLFYTYLARKQWTAALETVSVLQLLQGDGEVLMRFRDLVDYLSSQDSQAVPVYGVH